MKPPFYLVRLITEVKWTAYYKYEGLARLVRSFQKERKTNIGHRYRKLSVTQMENLHGVKVQDRVDETSSKMYN
jgi:predicted RNA-binding protein with PUA domain